jgi:hypothetical protein
MSSAMKDLTILMFVGSTAVLDRKSILKQLEKPMNALFQKSTSIFKSVDSVIKSDINVFVWVYGFESVESN